MEFPPTLVINLDDRKDRWEGIQASFAKWPVKLERVPAIKENPGWKGCYNSHKKCIQIAKERNYPWVLLLEDDCRLYENSSERFQKILSSLWEKRDTWEFFNGGPTFIDKIQKIQNDPPLFKLEGYATHFCLFNQSVYDKIINFPEKQIDALYRENLSMICTRPHIAFQDLGKSDILDTDVDYSGMLTSSNDALEKEGFQNKEEDEFSIKFIMLCITIVLAINIYK
jgi:glycosyl transferase family 25